MKFFGSVAIHLKDIENDKQNGELRKLVQAAHDSM